MSAPAGLITQVERPGAARPAQAAAAPPPKKGLFAKLCGCCASSNASSSGATTSPMAAGNQAGGQQQPQQQQQQQQQGGANNAAAAAAAQRRAPGMGDALLGPMLPQHRGRKCLVLDLDETLVHSSFSPVPNADFIIPVEIENHIHQVYVLKRPGVDEFMRRMGEIYEVVVFTASLAKYADPVLDLLDIHRVVTWRLFRESCTSHKGNFVKDMSRLGRPLKDSIIIDNSPASYMFHPENAVPIDSWFDDERDTELLDLIPFLEELAVVPDVVVALGQRR